MPRKSSGSTWTITRDALMALAIAAAAAAPPAAPALMKHLPIRPPNVILTRLSVLPRTARLCRLEFFPPLVRLVLPPPGVVEADESVQRFGQHVGGGGPVVPR